MSFVDQNDVMSALEEVLADAFGRMGVEMPTPLRRMDYWEAMDTYGSDKPDTRYGMHLVDLTDIFANSKFKVFATAANEEGSVVKAINAKGAGAWARAKIDKLAGVASTFGAKGLAWIAFREDGSINSPIVKFFSDEEMAALRERMDVEPGDLVMFAAGPRLLSDEILGGMRSHMANALEIKREGHDFLWVVNFPLFHWDEDRKAYAAEHQPFTLPTETDIAKIEADPLAAGSCTYDFVMDGFEAGGGGMRIHNAEMQMSMLKLLGFTEERAESQFGFLMEALKFGARPMRGFALTWRRTGTTGLLPRAMCSSASTISRCPAIAWQRRQSVDGSGAISRALPTMSAMSWSDSVRAQSACSPIASFRMKRTLVPIGTR